MITAIFVFLKGKRIWKIKLHFLAGKPPFVFSRHSALAEGCGERSGFKTEPKFLQLFRGDRKSLVKIWGQDAFFSGFVTVINRLNPLNRYPREF